MRKRTRKLLIWLVIILGAILSFIPLCSTKLQITNHTFLSNKITKPFKAALITDIHASDYGPGLQELLDAVQKSSPDIVCMVGDIFDSRHDNAETWTFVSNIVQQYRCYYVTGNHEARLNSVSQEKQKLRELGVIVLDNEMPCDYLPEFNLEVMGVDDALVGLSAAKQVQFIRLQPSTGVYQLMLAHRPNVAIDNPSLPVDLILSGHAHGGQVRIPLIAPNGLYAPGQGVFPKYTGGYYEVNGNQLYVSRGLDTKSVDAPRVLNRPELVILEFQPAE